MGLKIHVITFDRSATGGIETVTRQLEKFLDDNFSEVEYIEFKGNRILQFIMRLYLNAKLTFFKNNKFIFMHSYLLNKVLTKGKNNKFFLFCHGIEVWGSHGAITNRRISLTDHAFCVSSFTQQEVRRNFGNICTSIVKLYPELTGHKKNKDQINRTQKLKLLSVSRLSFADRYKGVERVLYAIHKLKTDGICLEYTIVGEGDDRMRLQQICSSLGLESMVHFTGFISDQHLKKVYTEADIFILPSKLEKKEYGIWSGEGLGLVYLQAGICHLPIIAYKEGGQTDFVEDNTNGMLVGDEINDIVLAVGHYHFNRDDIYSHGRAAFYKVMTYYSRKSFHDSLSPITLMKNEE